FCNVPSSHVLQNLDVEYLYEVPLVMEEEHLADVVCGCLKLENNKPDLSEWKQMVNALRNPKREVRIALVGNYIQLHDAYLSVVVAVNHGGVAAESTVVIDRCDAVTITEQNVEEELKEAHGILVLGEFGDRGTQGKILAISYARIHH